MLTIVVSSNDIPPQVHAIKLYRFAARRRVTSALSYRQMACPFGRRGD